MKLEQVYLNYYICVENDQNDIYFSIFKMKKMEMLEKIFGLSIH